MCRSTWYARPHEKAIQPERYRMSIGCPSRSLPPLFLCLSFSLFFFILILFLLRLIFPSIRSQFTWLSSLAPPYSSIYTRPPILSAVCPLARLRYPHFFLSVCSTCLCLSLSSLVPTVCCSPSAFNIDYETTNRARRRVTYRIVSEIDVH